jgi:hypothetical protein
MEYRICTYAWHQLHLSISTGSMSNVKQKLGIRITRIEMFIFFLFALFFLCFQHKKMTLDLWNDEIYTLINFVFVPLSKTLCDYHVPNNHIFLNIVIKIYNFIFSIHSLSELLLQPNKLRALPLGFSLVGIYLFWKMGMQFFSQQIAILSTCFFITCIPFLNFSLQIRGYGLSILFVIILLYLSLSYVQRQKKRQLIMIVLFSALVMYTIPSNILFLLSILCIFVLLLFFQIDSIDLKKNFNHAVFKNKYFKLSVATLAGIMLCVLFYVPIFQEVFFNNYVKADASSYKDVIIKFEQCSIDFISNRYFAVILAGLGITISLFKKMKKSFVIPGFCLLFLYVFPFIISFLRKDNAPERVYTYTIPLLALAMAIFVNIFLEAIVTSKIWQSFLIVFICFVSLGTCFNEQLNIESKLRNNIVIGERSQDLYDNYFLSSYHPLSTAISLKKLKNEIIVMNDCEPYDLPIYLKNFNVVFYEASVLDSIINTQPQQVYIITRFPYNTQKEYKDKKYNYSFERMDTDYSYHNIIKLSKHGDE